MSLMNEFGKVKKESDKLGAMLKDRSKLSHKEWFSKHGSKFEHKKKELSKKSKFLESERKEHKHWKKMSNYGDRTSEDYRG